MVARYANNASSLLAGAISASSTTVSVASGEGVKFPILANGDHFMATMVKMVGPNPVFEIVRVTARNGDILTMSRAQEGTIAVTFSAGDKIDLRLTAGGIDAKADRAGADFTGPVSTTSTITMADTALARAVLKDTGYAFKDDAGGTILDYTEGPHHRFAPGTGPQALNITNWPPAGVRGEMLVEGVNLGAAAIAGPAVNWIKTDGKFTVTSDWNANHGIALQAAGIDFILLWTRDAGATLYGKVIR
ncbi:MAG: hypothetical protein K0S54_1137 [Alphaproteobacteria bacterium]|jgi:hypothetical protein|nr:hypothetical protein [Alphaproteobacteria bacterium]